MPSSVDVAQIVKELLPAIRKDKDKLREDLGNFLRAFESLREARRERRGREAATEEIWGHCQQLCKLSRSILFGIWPEEDGIPLTKAVIELFLAAAECFPDSTDQFPHLSGYRDNIQLRAFDLQPYVSSMGPLTSTTPAAATASH